MKLLIIFNPNAGYGRFSKRLEAIREKFQSLNINTTFLITSHCGHGKELVAAADLSEFDGLVAAGGDGTVFEVLNGLYEHPKPDRIPMGLIPIGTGNAFARELGLQPSEWQQAIEILARQRYREIDVGYVNSADQSYYFLNIVSLGFSVDASLSAHKLKFFGKAAYTLATLWQALKFKSYPLEMDLQGDIKHSDNVFVTISNSRYTGTHFLIAPDARIDDGLLDVTVLENLPRCRLLRLFPTVYTGRHIEYSEISTHQVSNINVQSPKGMLLGPDGEFCGRTPAEIGCLSRDLCLYY